MFLGFFDRTKPAYVSPVERGEEGVSDSDAESRGGTPKHSPPRQLHRLDSRGDPKVDVNGEPVDKVEQPRPANSPIGSPKLLIAGSASPTGSDRGKANWKKLRVSHKVSTALKGISDDLKLYGVTNDNDEVSIYNITLVFQQFETGHNSTRSSNSTPPYQS